MSENGNKTHVGTQLGDDQFKESEERRKALGLTRSEMLRKVVREGLAKPATTKPGGLVTSLPPGGCNCVGFGHQVGCPSYAPKRSG